MLLKHDDSTEELKKGKGKKFVTRVKQIFYQAYKSAYNDNDNNKNSPDFQMALA